MYNCLLHPDPPPAVRLMTVKDTLKSKGCAFLEFTHSNALLQGLKLHHTQLDGRQINVELTAGGGGKSTARISKLKQRNAQLGRQRDRLEHRDQSKQAEKAHVSSSQRHSTTSGAELPKQSVKPVKLTAGGKRPGKAKLRKTPYTPTGANAVSLGS